ncbi:MAG: hypothetical protein QXG00_06935 [Candidatus Woesearchaeota archaeon]
MKTTKKTNTQKGNSEHSNISKVYSLRIKIKNNHTYGKIHLDERFNLFTIMNNMR